MDFISGNKTADNISLASITHGIAELVRLVMYRGVCAIQNQMKLLVPSLSLPENQNKKIFSIASLRTLESLGRSSGLAS